MPTYTQPGQGFTELEGDYDYFLPNVDLAWHLNEDVVARASFSETIGRPGWQQIQGGQRLANIVRVDGGDGSAGNPARCLASHPKLLLLDEPSSGLDESETDAFGELLAQLAAEGRAILMVEHDMDLVMSVCDDIHVLDFGRVIASGPPAEIRANPEVQRAYLGYSDVEDPAVAASDDTTVLEAVR